MFNPQNRLILVLVWLICGMLILAMMSRYCAYEPLAPHEFVPRAGR